MGECLFSPYDCVLSEPFLGSPLWGWKGACGKVGERGGGEIKHNAAL